MWKKKRGFRLVVYLWKGIFKNKLSNYVYKSYLVIFRRFTVQNQSIKHLQESAPKRVRSCFELRTHIEEQRILKTLLHFLFHRIFQWKYLSLLEYSNAFLEGYVLLKLHQKTYFLVSEKTNVRTENVTPACMMAQ